MNIKQLHSHSGRFVSLSFREGVKTKIYCAKIVKITPHTISFRDINSGEVITKKSTSFLG